MANIPAEVSHVEQGPPEIKILEPEIPEENILKDEYTLSDEDPHVAASYDDGDEIGLSRSTLIAIFVSVRTMEE